MSPFPRKAPSIPSTCCSLPRIFQLFLSRDTVLLWRALLTRLRHCLASGALPPFPYLANTCLCFGSLVRWLVDLLIVEKAACAFPPPLPLLCLWAPAQKVPYHQDLGCGQPWRLSPSAHRLLTCLFSEVPMPQMASGAQVFPGF